MDVLLLSLQTLPVDKVAAPAVDPMALLIASLTIFVLAIFVGFEIITKVPPTLHTPLMSGSNAISGITIIGALLVASSVDRTGFSGILQTIHVCIYPDIITNTPRGWKGCSREGA